MQRTLIRDLKAGEDVLLQGWVQEIRNLSKIKFIILRDRSGDMQTLALKAKTDPESFDAIDNLTKESVVEIIGTPKENKESRWGIEVVIKSINVLTLAETPLPIDNTDKSNTNIDKRLDHRYLDTRNKKVAAIFRVRAKIQSIISRFLEENDFMSMQTPKMTNIGVESGAELFTIDYFGKPMYLAQSPQVYKQMFMNGGFERVFEIGPVFRAEKSNTTRHVTEFTGVDFEMAFIKDYNDVMTMVEKMFIRVLTDLNTQAKEGLELLGVTLNIPKEIPRISMTEAKKILSEKKYSEDDDLDPEGEKLLCKHVKEKYGCDFVFLTDFPYAVRPFYHMKENGVTKSFDLLYNGVEVCTGAQREHRKDVFLAQAKEKGIEVDPIYTELFQYGVPPHGGVGLGLDRIAQMLLGLENVREVILLPRDPDRRTP